jgi:hypothetical protein
MNDQLPLLYVSFRYLPVESNAVIIIEESAHFESDSIAAQQRNDAKRHKATSQKGFGVSAPAFLERFCLIDIGVCPL